jgi:hypothetical protein
VELATKSDDVLNVLFTEPVFEAFNSMKASSSVLNLRVLELMAKIAISSVNGFNSVSQSGMLNDLVLGMYECDVISFLNRVEILISLISIDSGYQYSESSGGLVRFPYKSVWRVQVHIDRPRTR